MQRLSILLLFLILAHTATLAQGWRPVGARSAGLANASVCLNDVWAFQHNPGALTGVKAFSAGVYYDARFLTKELQTQAIVAAIPLKKGVISAGGQFSGYEQYRYTRAGVGYALPLGEHISAGVQVNLQQLRFGGSYGSSSSATFEGGVLATISEKWQIGASVLNIGRQRILPLGDDRFTSVIRIGTLFKPSAKVSVAAEMEKQVIHPITIRGGVEYYPVESFVIRCGAQAGPTELSLGIGYRKQQFSLDLGSKYHPVLGWTPNVGFTYQPDHAK